jgi:hypothetical protein
MRPLLRLSIPLALALLASCEDKATAIVLKIKSTAAVDCVFVTLESGDTKVKEQQIDLRKSPHREQDWLRPYEADGLARGLTLTVLVYPGGDFKDNQVKASAYGRLGGCEAANPITSKAAQVGPIVFVKDQIVDQEMRLEPSCDRGDCDPDKDGYGPVDDCQTTQRGVNPHATEICTDIFDNNCNGKSDCEDEACDGKACSDARTCIAGICECTGGGTETSCEDHNDNDCDGLVDCTDSDCNAKACGLNGLTCSNGACLCPGSSGPVPTPEANCSDNTDNDCDNAVDCADSDCDGQDCGPNGRICSAGACGCDGNGGTPQPGGEQACGDGNDNDCDGLIDCLDPDCHNVTCGANGRVCSSVSKKCICSDCTADSTCQSQLCDLAGKKSKVCCGTGASAACKDLSTDVSNCGGCGEVCGTVEFCNAVVEGLQTVSGRCSCLGGTPSCPDSQACYTASSPDMCECQSTSECATGGTCYSPSTGPNYCKYPSQLP